MLGRDSGLTTRIVLDDTVLEPESEITTRNSKDRLEALPPRRDARSEGASEIRLPEELFNSSPTPKESLPKESLPKESLPPQ